MALCCFLVPQPLSVSFQPQAAHVAQPQRCQLGLKPLSTVLFWEGPACCLQPGLWSEPSALPAEPEKGDVGAHPPVGELAQAGSVRALDRCPSFLPPLILPSKVVLESGLSLAPPVLCGRRKLRSASQSGTRERGRRGQGGQTRSEGAGRPAAVLPFLTRGVGATDVGMFVFLLLCH